MVQGCAGVAVVGCAGALCPAGEVVHGVGEHAERLPGRRVEVGEELVVVGGGCALESGEDGDPAERGGGERWLPGARAERERLFGAAAQRRPSAGDDLGEAEPGQRVQDEHAGAGVAGAGGHRGEAAVVGFVVAEVQGGVAEVGEQVEVADVGADLERVAQGRQGGCPVVGGGAGQGEQEVAEAAGAGRGA